MLIDLFLVRLSLSIIRMTTYISVFSVTQPVAFDNGLEEPRLGLAGATAIFFLLIFVHFGLVTFYKMRYSGAWRQVMCWAE